MIDPKPAARIRDADLMRLMHADPRKECCLTSDTWDLELHHILPRSQRGDDVRANLVWLTSEAHRLVTRNDEGVLRRLGEHIRTERLDTQAYLTMKLGPVGAQEWLRRRLYIGE